MLQYREGIAAFSGPLSNKSACAILRMQIREQAQPYNKIQ